MDSSKKSRLGFVAGAVVVGGLMLFGLSWKMNQSKERAIRVAMTSDVRALAKAATSEQEWSFESMRDYLDSADSAPDGGSLWKDYHVKWAEMGGEEMLALDLSGRVVAINRSGVVRQLSDADLTGCMSLREPLREQ